MQSARKKWILSQIIPFGVIWMLFSIVYLFLEKGLIGDLDYYPSTGNPYNFEINLISGALLSGILGFAVGSFEVLYLSKKFKYVSLAKKLAFKILIYVMIIVAFLTILTLVGNALRLNESPFSEAVVRNLGNFFFNFAFWSVVLFVAVIVAISLFYAEARNNTGYGMINNFFAGKYHRPIQEERIFMFCDMKSSTTIAEKLGHEKYFELLNDYYADISAPIVDYFGEIYQYVGDEIIVTWKLDRGLLNNNFLNCFFSMKKALEVANEKYNSKYGVVPSFKAGFHRGRVTTGEIGTIKKDIVFSGDVLNTTARVQGLCNQYKTDVIMTEDLVTQISDRTDMEIEELGKTELRGKSELVKLYKIRKKI